MQNGYGQSYDGNSYHEQSDGCHGALSNMNYGDSHNKVYSDADKSQRGHYSSGSMYDEHCAHDGNHDRNRQF